MRLEAAGFRQAVVAWAGIDWAGVEEQLRMLQVPLPMPCLAPEAVLVKHWQAEAMCHSPACGMRMHLAAGSNCRCRP